MSHLRPVPFTSVLFEYDCSDLGSGTVTGALADFLAAILNSNLGGGNHAAGMVED